MSLAQGQGSTVEYVVRIGSTQPTYLLASQGNRACQGAVIEVVTIGYQGRSQQQVVELLRADGVKLLVDVRLNPISRKPGLSKKGLGAALNEAGIEYEHIKALGTPLDIRGLFRANQLDDARAQYRDYLVGEQPEALAELGAEVGEQRTALLCFELDVRECHRLVVGEELERLVGATLVHL